MLLSHLLDGIPVTGKYLDVDVQEITDNSNNVTVGCLFVCIKGARFDAHRVAYEVLQKGAAAVVVERDIGIEKQIVVEDSRAAYALLCKNFFGRSCDKLEIIGVTGTNGKTTTTFVIKDMLELLGEGCGLIGTVKNIIGEESVPSVLTTPDPFVMHALFKRMTDLGLRYCVIEVSSQALHQKRLEGINFAVGVLTNISRDHLDYHGNIEEYIAAKKELFRRCDKAVINNDDERAPYFKDGVTVPVLTYSAVKDSMYKASDIEYRSDSVSYTLETCGETYDVKFGIAGTFSVYNSLSAITAVCSLGYSAREVSAAAAKAKSVLGRLESVKAGQPYNIIIDYAHTPDGLEKAIEAVKSFTDGRVLTVFGCGGDRDSTKRPMMGRIASEISDITVVTSDNPRTENPQDIIDEILEGIEVNRGNIFIRPDRTEAIALALNTAKKGDTVLLAGKGHETYQIIGTEKKHYDEREIIAELLHGEGL